MGHLFERCFEILPRGRVLLLHLSRRLRLRPDQGRPGGRRHGPVRMAQPQHEVDPGGGEALLVRQARGFVCTFDQKNCQELSVFDKKIGEEHYIKFAQMKYQEDRKFLTLPAKF